MRRKLVGILFVALFMGLLPGLGRGTSPRILNPTNGHEYMTVPVDQEITWQQAAAAAAAMGGYLVTITSQAEQDFLLSNFPELAEGRWWIGAFQPSGSSEPTGDWQWVTGETWSYSNWSGGEPNDNVGSEDEALLWHGGTWNDCVGTCHSTGYIVEFEPTVPPPPPTPQPVSINVKPGSWPNATNVRAGRIPVAILTTTAGEYGTTVDFDATQVNVESLRFGPLAVLDAGGGGTPVGGAHLEDAVERDEVTRDGDTDMVLHFSPVESGITTATTEVCLRGTLMDGTPFQACDAIKVNGR